MKLLNLLYVSLLAILISSCADQPELNNVQYDGVSVYDLAELDIDLSEEQKDLINTLMERKDHNIALQATANWGRYNRVNPSASYTLMGHYPGDLTIELEGEQYPSVNPENMEYYTNENFANMFGQTNEFTLRNSRKEETFKSYIPTKLKATKLGADQSMEIFRGSSDNVISWESDPENDLEVVLLSYTCRENTSGDPLAGRISKSDIIVLEDDGEYDINDIIEDPNVGSIQLSIYRGKAFVFDNTLFSIVTNDLHLYEVSNNQQ